MSLLKFISSLENYVELTRKKFNKKFFFFSLSLLFYYKFYNMDIFFLGDLANECKYCIFYKLYEFFK